MLFGLPVFYPPIWIGRTRSSTKFNPRTMTQLQEQPRIVNGTFFDTDLTGRLSRREWRAISTSERRYQKDQRRKKLAKAPVAVAVGTTYEQSAKRTVRRRLQLVSGHAQPTERAR